MSKYSKPAVPQVTFVLYSLKKKKVTFRFYQLDWSKNQEDYVQNKESSASPHVQK